LCFGRYAGLIPLATLASILVIVAYHMSEWRTFTAELRAPKSDVAVLLTTFGLTVLVDLTVAISVGMVLTAFLFIRRMATVTSVNFFAGDAEVDDDLASDPAEPWRLHIPRGTSVFEIKGPLFFGAVETFRSTLEHLDEHPRVLIIRMRDVYAVDATGIRALKDVIRRTDRDGSRVLLTDVQPQPRAALSDAGVLDLIGEANVLPDIDDGLARAYELGSFAAKTK
ncbi:MAG: SulP family inorganic anion transporter, partial [Thermoanaerobaculia bacterium]